MTESELKQEVAYWKHVAAYLAECHAANLHEAEHKSCSKYRRKRFQSIMNKAASFLTKEVFPVYFLKEDPDQSIQSVVERLKDHSAKIPI